MSEETRHLEGMISELLSRVNGLEQAVSDCMAVAESAGGASGGDSSAIERVMMDPDEESGAFAIDGDSLVNCVFQFGRHVYSIADQTLSGDGTYYLCIPHSDPTNATVSTSLGDGTTETQTVIPLFSISGGNITADYRGMPVIPVYE